MGSLGWFILGYMATGIIASYSIGYVLLAVAFVKDYRRTQKKIKAGEIESDAPIDTACGEAYNELARDCVDKAAQILDSDNPKRGEFKMWFFGNCIAWPITVPHGAIALWNQIKEADRNQ